MGVETVVLRNFRGLAAKPNRLGAPSTGFWQRAGESTDAVADEGQALITVRHRGVGLQLHGGTVRPTQRRVLTIPVDAEAHGKRVSDFPKGTLFRPKGKD